MADTTPLSIAFDFAKSGVDGARARLDDIRSRAATLISAASIASSFLGAQVLKDKRPSTEVAGPADVVAIVAFVAVGVACMYILWPRKRAWPFSFSANVIVEGYADVDASLGATQRALIRYLERNRVKVEAKLETLYQVFAIGVGLLGVEVLCWLVNLVWGKKA